ncbi:hypothetical protein FSP39_025325 [Pinctada imbricata]|uniref:Carboxylic ester hydrolase n=1 Tax=Pinctada imbricata TaxID=66713 RepID=A0AA89BUD3_PINIB|nr:hypothetical protein FSP39_025325 [Pinctada imbricata]
MFLFYTSTVIIALCTLMMTVADDPIVETSNGRVAGFKQNVGGTVIDTFLNIPFAEPPIGDLRFKRPVPVTNWTGTYEAKTGGNSCHQLIFTTFKGKQGEKGENMWNANTTRHEDCLQLNIWSPVTQEQKLTTMIWIFGGGFVYGTPTLDLYDGKLLAAQRGVIVVSINYRVGPLGFLYAGNDEAPGNVGLLDQQMALKWIYTNIEAFGGNTEDITLFGESAGAASVSYHLMSAGSTPYFQRAILQSGSALAPWAYQSPYVAKIYTKTLAGRLGCLQTAYTDIVKCLRTKDAAQMSDEQWNLPLTPLSFPFVPTLDNHFITKSPSDFFHSGNLNNKDILVGVNDQEAMFFLFYWLVGYNTLSWPNNDLSNATFLREMHSVVSQNGLEAKDNASQAVIDAVLYEYERHILPGVPRDYMMILDDIGGDFAFKCPVINLAKTYAKTSGVNVYMYAFKQRPSVSAWPSWTGVLHGDEIEFVFGLPLRENTNYTYNEQQFSSDLMKYWSTFAKTGRPSDLWPRFSSDFEEYQILQADFPDPYTPKTGRGLRRRECLFWSEYIPKLKEQLKKATMAQSGNCINTSDSLSATFYIIFFTSLLCIFKGFHYR